MLNEVFIAVGTMSVSPGSRWRNRVREKEPPGGGGRLERVGGGVTEREGRGVAGRMTQCLC